MKFIKKQLTTFLIIPFFALGYLLFAIPIYAETETSGNITSNTTWVLENSPYVITQTVQILEGVKLEIEPGVVINFNQNTALVVGGELIAIGTDSQKITFHGGTITFNNKSIDATTDQNNNYISGSVIKNSIIESGKTIGLNIVHASPLINNNIIRNYTSGSAGGYAIHLDYSNSIIENNLIDNNSITAINIYFSGAEIKNNIITNNLTAFQISGGTSEISRNIVKDNNYGGLYLQFGANPKIQYNNIFQNGTSNNDAMANNNIWMAQNTDITADNNYWGTINTSLIDTNLHDYYDNIGLGKVNYEPYALAELKFDGTDTFSQPPTCTSRIYSDWSTCQSNGIQTRTVISSSPSGCSGGNPILTQSCTYTPPTCTSWTYSDWSACNNGQQTREIISSQPTNCTDGSPVLNQNCTAQYSTCASWTFSDWGSCVSGWQTRTIISFFPNNCIGGNHVLSQSCQTEANNIKNNGNQVIEHNDNITNNSDSITKSISKEVIAEEKSLITKIDNTLSKRISGKILLQVEKNGEGWYVYPDNKKKYYLGRPADAFGIMRNLGLGVAHNELAGYLTAKFPIRLSGKIMLDVEQNGEAYYVNPNDLKGYYLSRPADAFRIMRELGLGITNSDIRKIDVGEVD